MYQRIRYYLKATETGNSSVLAKEMLISSQALIKQSGELEKELGGIFFKRSPQGIAITAFGEKTQQKLRIIKEETNEAVRDLRKLAVLN